MVVLVVSMIGFQALSEGSPGPVLEVTGLTEVNGTERVEVSEESYVPSLTVLLVDEDPFNISNWVGYDTGLYNDSELYGYWDTLSRRFTFSILNLTDLLIEVQFRVEGGPKSVELVYWGTTNSTSGEGNRTQSLTLHFDLRNETSWVRYLRQFSRPASITLNTHGGLFEDVEIVSLKVWATSNTPLVPVSFELRRSNNESLRVPRQNNPWIGRSGVELWPSTNHSLHGEFTPWQSADRVFLPPGNYSGHFLWALGSDPYSQYEPEPFNLTLTAEHSVNCRMYVHVHEVSFVSDIGLFGLELFIDDGEGSTHLLYLLDFCSTIVPPVSSISVSVLEWGPHTHWYFYGINDFEMILNGSSDVTVRFQMPSVATYGPVSVSASLLLFLIVLSGMLAIMGVQSFYTHRHENGYWLASRTGPTVLFVLSFLLPGAFGHNLVFYESSYHEVYWVFFPGVITVLQWMDTGHLTVLAQDGLWGSSFMPVLVVMWLCVAVFMLLNRFNTQRSRVLQLFIFSVSLILEIVLGIIFATSHFFDTIPATGPILMAVGILWFLYFLWKARLTPPVGTVGAEQRQKADGVS